MIRYKYTDAAIAEAVDNSNSITGVMRYLGMRMAGGNWTHVNNRVQRLGIDISHFGDKASRGAAATNDSKKKPPDEILRIYPQGSQRVKHYQLKRAMLESGFAYQCSNADCPVTGGEWRNKSLTLQIDHINGDPLDSRRENLRFLCPNCHTQTDSYGRKRR